MSDQENERVEYTPEEQKAIIDHVRFLHTTGKPGAALKLKARFLAGEEILPADYTRGVFPEKDVADLSAVKPPGRTGPGSSRDAWVKWGLAVMDVEPEIFDNLSRADIVALAQERGIIPPDKE